MLNQTELLNPIPMLNIKKILFPTDFSPCAESAFSHAAYLADRHTAELHVLHVQEDESMTLSERLSEIRITPDEIAEQLHLPLPEGNAGSNDPIPVIEIEEKAERAAPVILHYAEANGVDLIVMGTHGRRGVRRFVLGSVAEEVVRLSQCPVFTVRHRDDMTTWRIRRILAPTDFSPNARLATRHAAALAETYGAELTLLHVVNAAGLPVASVPPLGSIELSAESIMARSNEILLREAQALRDEFGLGTDVHSFVRIGHPALDILDFMDENDSDLVVIGTHGRSGIRRLLMGSVAEQVVRNASCPVFTVKSYGESLLDPVAISIEETVPA
ncbi:MAG: universal stress protein [Rubricoccaceae bacterium]|nr:universal stress protein [Rubricoccaceae bacterium]